MFHSTISPTASNSTFSLSSFGRNVNESSAHESKNQTLYSKAQEGQDSIPSNLTRQVPSFAKDVKVGEVDNKNDNNIDRFGFKSGEKNAVKDLQSEKIIGGG